MAHVPRYRTLSLNCLQTPCAPWDPAVPVAVRDAARGGYRSGKWKGKPKLQGIANRVAETARRYEGQLQRCESEFRCDSWWQVWPLCS